MIELVVRYIGFKALKMFWRKRFPKLSLYELIEKREKMIPKLELCIREGRYLESVNQRRRIAGVQMKIMREFFKRDMKAIKEGCKGR